MKKWFLIIFFIAAFSAAGMADEKDDKIAKLQAALAKTTQALSDSNAIIERQNEEIKDLKAQIDKLVIDNNAVIDGYIFQIKSDQDEITGLRNTIVDLSNRLALAKYYPFTAYAYYSTSFASNGFGVDLTYKIFRFQIITGAEYMFPTSLSVKVGVGFSF